MLFDASKGEAGLKEALDHLCKEAAQAVTDGANYLVLTDRQVDASMAVIPSVLAVSAVHHYLISVKNVYRQLWLLKQVKCVRLCMQPCC